MRKSGSIRAVGYIEGIIKKVETENNQGKHKLSNVL